MQKLSTYGLLQHVAKFTIDDDDVYINVTADVLTELVEPLEFLIFDYLTRQKELTDDNIFAFLGLVNVKFRYIVNGVCVRVCKYTKKEIGNTFHAVNNAMKSAKPLEITLEEDDKVYLLGDYLGFMFKHKPLLKQLSGKTAVVPVFNGHTLKGYTIRVPKI